MTPEIVAMSVAMRTAGENTCTVWEALFGALAAAFVLFVLYMVIGFIGVIVQDIGWWLRHRRKK